MWCSARRKAPYNHSNGALKNMWIGDDVDYNDDLLSDPYYRLKKINDNIKQNSIRSTQYLTRRLVS